MQNLYYYASMFALLKPWRSLDQLKDDNESCELAFHTFTGNASQRDKDIILGSQYYYKSKDINKNIPEDGSDNLEETGDEVDNDDAENGDRQPDESTNLSVSKLRLLCAVY